MRNYFKETDQVVRRELRRIVRQPMYWVLMVVLPVVSFAFFAVIFERGVARNIPIAVLDEDHTTLSRKVTQMIDDTPTAMVSYEVQSMEEAQRLMREGRISAIVHIPAFFEKNILSNSQTHIECSVSGTNITVNGGTLGYVYGGPGDLTIQQRLSQSGFVDQGAACGVKQKNARFHHGKGFSIDEMMVFCCQRAVQGKNVALAQHFFQRITAFPTGGRKVQNLHAESGGNPSDCLPDASVTDQPHCFAVELDLGIIPEAEFFALCPSALLHRLIVGPDTVTEFQ